MTIAEIAEIAHVSKTAVSRYLNHGYISAEKSEAIRRVIAETGYVPSRQAQTLRTGKSFNIGVIVPRIASESISRIVAGISAVLEQNGYHLLLANTENRAEKELEYLEVFRRDPVDGVILVATMLTSAHKKALEDSTCPIVLIGQQMDGVSCVYHNDFAAARAMTARLTENSRTRIGYIGVTTHDKAAGAARRAGYCAALQSAKLTLDPARMVQSDFSVEGGDAAAARLLAHSPDIDGIFCATDSIAVGAMRYLINQGKRIPCDIAMTGIGHSRLSSLVRPTLTTAHYYYEKSGEEAARALLEKFTRGGCTQMMLGFDVCVQESCE